MGQSEATLVRPYPGVEGNHISPATTKVYACCNISLLHCRTIGGRKPDAGYFPKRKLGRASEKLGT